MMRLVKYQDLNDEFLKRSVALELLLPALIGIDNGFVDELLMMQQSLAGDRPGQLKEGDGLPIKGTELATGLQPVQLEEPLESYLV